MLLSSKAPIIESKILQFLRHYFRLNSIQSGWVNLSWATVQSFSYVNSIIHVKSFKGKSSSVFHHPICWENLWYFVLDINSGSISTATINLINTQNSLFVNERKYPQINSHYLVQSCSKSLYISVSLKLMERIYLKKLFMRLKLTKRCLCNL